METSRFHQSLEACANLKDKDLSKRIATLYYLHKANLQVNLIRYFFSLYKVDKVNTEYYLPNLIYRLPKVLT